MYPMFLNWSVNNIEYTNTPLDIFKNIFCTKVTMKPRNPCTLTTPKWDPDDFLVPSILHAEKTRRRKILTTKQNSDEKKEYNTKRSLSFKMAQRDCEISKPCVRTTSDPLHKRNVEIHHSAFGWTNRVY